MFSKEKPKVRGNSRLRKLVMMYLALAILFGGGLMTSSMKSASAAGTVSSCGDYQEFKNAVMSNGGVVNVTCADKIWFPETLNIYYDTTIIGANLAVGSGNQYGIFHVWPNVKLTLIDTGLSGGKSTGSGGAIEADHAELVLQNVSISGSQAYYGGGINLFGGKLTATNVTFNSTTALTRGGAIYAEGATITIKNSNFFANHAGNGLTGGLHRDGGAISVGNSTLNIEGSYFEDNSAQDDGGAIALNSEWNAATKGTINTTTFHHNRAGGYGGALFSPNTNLYGVYQINNSTLYENSAYDGGAVFQFSPHYLMEFANSTIANNKATALGGGLYQAGGNIQLDNVTVANNQAGKGGNLYVTEKYSVLIRNTIVANGVGGNCAGGGLPLSDVGPNMQYPGNECSATMTVANPKLVSIFYNGGPTPTMALTAGSPAINKGDSQICGLPGINNKDQRGQARVGQCDLGAFEFILTPITPRHPTDFTKFSFDNLTGWAKSPAQTVSEN